MNIFDLLEDILWDCCKIDIEPSEEVDPDGTLHISHRSSSGKDLQKVIDNLPDGVVVIHHDYELVSPAMNEGFEEWLTIKIPA